MKWGWVFGGLYLTGFVLTVTAAMFGSIGWVLAGLVFTGGTGFLLAYWAFTPWWPRGS